MKHAGYWLLVRSGLYAWWSKLYQWLWDRKHAESSPTWKGSLTPKGAADLVEKIAYHPDGWRELGDAFHHPCCGDALINEAILASGLDPAMVLGQAFVPGQVGQVRLGGIRKVNVYGVSWDCDDAALWCAWSVKGGFGARVMNVIWATGWWPWQVKGHNVCVVREGSTFAHIGNWGRRGGFHSVDDVMKDVLGCMGVRLGQLVGCHVMNRESLTARL